MVQWGLKGGLQNGVEEGGGGKSPHQAITIYNLRHKVEKGNTFSSKDQTSLKFSFSEYFFWLFLRFVSPVVNSKNLVKWGCNTDIIAQKIIARNSVIWKSLITLGHSSVWYLIICSYCYLPKGCLNSSKSLLSMFTE